MQDETDYINVSIVEWEKLTGQTISREEAREIMQNLATLILVLDDIDRQTRKGNHGAEALANCQDSATIPGPIQDGGHHGAA